MSTETTPGHRSGFFTLALGSAGVVYGDIGTSPLYALKESVKIAGTSGAALPALVLGMVSLILWTLVAIVSAKYVGLIMRADNKGEGGILALSALAHRAMGDMALLAILGMLGAALFYGDAILTPAVSVLSAVEGLNLISHRFEPYMVGMALVILTVLFAVQNRGTARVAALFGPIMAVWFLVLALAGLPHIIANPTILQALNPLVGLRFILAHGSVAFVTLGTVFLAVTGAEALYADMGHFGRRPIQVTWLAFVFPCLALNYLGQGALLLDNPAAAANPFFFLFPDWALIPMVALATMATIIASQAGITGAFSLTQQAIQLKLLPRMQIKQTSENERGQIYISKINWLLFAGVVAVVLMFRSSEALTAAYGIAVSGTMVITALLAYFVAWRVWGWSQPVAALVVAPFLLFDLGFLTANSVKLFEGGWLPLLFGAGLLVVMLTWWRGSHLLSAQQARESLAIDMLEGLVSKVPTRVAGTGIFFTPRAEEIPPALLHSLKHFKVLHDTTILVTVTTADSPRVAPEKRAVIEPLAPGFTRITLYFGFMEIPNVPRALGHCRKLGSKFETMKTSFILSKRTLRCSQRTQMPWWQDWLFVRLSNSQSDASVHFHIPSQQAVELGRQVSI